MSTGKVSTDCGPLYTPKPQENKTDDDDDDDPSCSQRRKQSSLHFRFNNV